MVKGKFYCKELGLLKVWDATARSFFFDIGIRWSNLTAKDKKTCQYAMWKVQKLPFGVPRGVKASEISENIVSMFYHEVKRSESSVLGYKSGHIEEDLLRGLTIPYLNLECFGCPKAKKLMKDMVWLETCGNHTIPDAYAHCAKLEVEANANWMEKTMNFY